MKQAISKNEYGFAHIGLILGSIFVLIAVALGGWYVWDKNKPDSGQTNNSSQATNEEKPRDLTEGGKYLVITEWGVRFELPEELRGDIAYYASNASASGTVLFSSQKLNNLTKDKACEIIVQSDGQYSGGLEAVLNRLNPDTYDLNYLDYFRSQLTYIKKSGEYEYYYKKSKTPPITCLTGTHEEFNGVEQTISEQLKQSFKTIETLETP